LEVRSWVPSTGRELPPRLQQGGGKVLRLYLGYPESVGSEGRFKLKDLFLKEVGVDYPSVPVEVKKKLLSMLDNLEKTNYLFIGEVYYDGIDLLEFALFGVGIRDYDELVLPGYLYRKPSNLVKNLIEESFAKKVNLLYDFNLFSRSTLVVNVGYTKTSVSLGGKLVSIIPLGEYHFVDFLGNYLFNRFVGETGISNSRLRKEGIRGELLDKCRATAARILFGRSRELNIPEFNYRRKVEEEEVELVLTPLTGSTNYGELVVKPGDFSSILVSFLYDYEERERERFKVEEAVIIGRLSWPFRKVLEKIFPVKVREVKEEELLSGEVVNKSQKPLTKNFSLKKEVIRAEQLNFKEVSGGIRELRELFNRRELSGLYLIEKLSEKLKGEELKSAL
jgi:hypothetical protein